MRSFEMARSYQFTRYYLIVYILYRKKYGIFDTKSQIFRQINEKQLIQLLQAFFRQNKAQIIHFVYLMQFFVKLPKCVSFTKFFFINWVVLKLGIGFFPREKINIKFQPPSRLINTG